MKTIFDVTYLLNQTTAPCTFEHNKDYMVLYVSSTSAYLNDILKVLGYLSIEKICDTFGISITPDVIESVSVYRYCGKRVTFALAPDADSEGWIIVCAEV